MTPRGFPLPNGAIGVFTWFLPREAAMVPPNSRQFVIHHRPRNGGSLVESTRGTRANLVYICIKLLMFSRTFISFDSWNWIQIRDSTHYQNFKCLITNQITACATKLQESCIPLISSLQNGTQILRPIAHPGDSLWSGVLIIEHLFNQLPGWHFESRIDGELNKNRLWISHFSSLSIHDGDVY